MALGKNQCTACPWSTLARNTVLRKNTFCYILIVVSSARRFEIIIISILSWWMVWILQRVNSSIWIAIKQSGSDMKWMNSLNDPEELVFKSTEALGSSENCYLLKVSNTTVYSNDETDPVTVVSRSCTGHSATDLALCMKRKCTFCFMKLMLEKFLANESWRRLRIISMPLATQYADFKTFAGLRVVMNDSYPTSVPSARDAWHCGLKCRRMKGCLGYNFNRGSKKCELLKDLERAKSEHYFPAKDPSV